MPNNHITYPSPRVSQLDAYILDGELFSLLKQQLADAFLLVSGKWWSYGQNPELWSLALKLIIFKLTTYKSGSSYGLKLQNLKLSTSSNGKIIGQRIKLFILATIFGDYFFKRLQSYLYSVDESSLSRGNSTLDRLKSSVIKHKELILKRIDDAVKILGTLNFVAFLVHGRYPTVLHRIMGVSLTPIIADLLKFDGDKVNFEFQNRQLVWNVMTEFLVFILPMLQLRKLRKLISSIFPSKKSEEFRLTSPTPIRTQFTNLPVSQCAICVQTIKRSGISAASTHVTNAFITNCGHIYCYVCLAATFNAIDSGNEEAEGCPRCRMKLTSFLQYGNSTEDIDKDAIMVEYTELEAEEESDVEQEKVETIGSDVSEDEHEYAETKETIPHEDFSEMEDLEEELEDDVEEEEDYDEYDEDFD